ncbi:MAG: ABC transporter permease [Planctomycetaceae bacterium]|nr:ABC transporter permease [Planctomycetaceae bacterium]
MKQFLGFLTVRIFPPVVAAVLFIFIWALVVRVFQIQSFLAPSPDQVWNVFVQDSPSLINATWLTGKAAVFGLLLSVVVGFLTASVFSQSSLLRYSLYPYAIFLQTVPVVAIAPLLVMWFGYGTTGVIAVAFILSLFPVIANVTEGMTSVPLSLRELFRLNQASRLQQFLKLQVPHSIPFLVTGVRTSSGLSVIGAIVGEFFVGYGGEGFGLGYLIRSSAERYQTDRLFAAVLLSTLLGVVIFAVVSLVAEKGLARFRFA